MRLTTKGRFAVTAMLDLALKAGEGPVSLAEISERQNISLSYLEQLFSKLRRAGLVDSVRGPGGGYTLAQEVHDMTVASIISAVDEPVDATQCSGHGNCMGKSQQCITHDLWTDLNETILEYLSEVTMEQLINNYFEKNMRQLVVESSCKSAAR